MDIPRSGNSFAVIAVLPAAFIPLLQVKWDKLPFVLPPLLSLIALVVALLLRYGFYMRRTPLVRIDETSLIFFGYAKAHRRLFQRSGISSIRLTRRPYFWRSAYRLSIVDDGVTVHLWVPHSAGGSVPALAKGLRENFPGQFIER